MIGIFYSESSGVQRGCQGRTDGRSCAEDFQVRRTRLVNIPVIVRMIGMLVRWRGAF